jgi:hypothetical protein
LLVQNCGDFLAGFKNRRRGGFADGTFLLKKYGGKNDFSPFDVEVFCSVEHGSFLAARAAVRGAPTVKINSTFLKIYQPRHDEPR